MRADRLLSIMLTLSARHRVTAAALADQLEVSERTIYRDIDALSLAGVPVYTQSGPNGGVFLDENYRVSLTALTQNELQTLFISGAQEALTALGLEQKAEDAVLKLLAALPTRQRAEAEYLRQRVYIDPSGWFPDLEHLPVLPALQHAVWHNIRVEMHYRSWSATYTTTVNPYSLVFKAGGWYLVAQREDGKFRTYRVHRILQLTPLEMHFERDDTFDVQTYWTDASRNFERRSSSYIATLRVTANALDFLQMMLGGRYQLIDTIHDDSQHFIVEAEFAGLDEARSMVLGMGGGGEVLHPDDLRRAVIEFAQRILETHEAYETEPHS